MTEGLRIEAAASVVARDVITKHLAAFSWALRRDRIAGQATVAAYVDGLAGVVALIVSGGHGNRDEVVEATVKSFREAVTRDLQHLKRG